MEFQKSENASLLVHMTADDKEMERTVVEYSLIDGRSIVDIQVVSDHF